MDIIIPKFPKNTSQKVWDQIYRWAVDGQDADRVLHESYLARVKKASDGIGAKAIDGVGECYAEMDSKMYHRQLQNDPNFWDDPGNVKKFFKDNTQYINQGFKV